MKKFAVVLVALGLIGCARAPFKTPSFGSVSHLDPAIVVEKFRDQLPQQFEISESVVFNYRGHKMTGLGYSKATPAAHSFVLAGVTPVGIKMFELKQLDKKLEYDFSLPQDVQSKIVPEKAAKAMADDFRRIYFDRVPEAQASIEKKKDRIIYRISEEGGMLEYIFGGIQERLVEKRFVKKRKKIWRVRYFVYQKKGGKIYPSAVFYQNHEAHYSIKLKLREILP